MWQGPCVIAAPLWGSAGIRSLVPQPGAATRVTRRHLLVDHRRHGVAGLMTVAGGKLTAWRSIAADVVADVLGEHDRSALRGAGHRATGAPAERVVSESLTPETRARLFALYGRRAGEVTALVEQDAWWGEPLIAGEAAIRAEVPHATEQEWAVTIGDVVLRRLGLGFGPDLGAAAGEQVGSIARQRLGWSKGRVERDLQALDEENRERRLPDLAD